MKFKTTIKAIREGSANVRSAGYCDLHHLIAACRGRALMAS